jgi:hypothetical protein
MCHFRLDFADYEGDPGEAPFAERFARALEQLKPDRRRRLLQAR